MVFLSIGDRRRDRSVLLYLESIPYRKFNYQYRFGVYLVFRRLFDGAEKSLLRRLLRGKRYRIDYHVEYGKPSGFYLLTHGHLLSCLFDYRRLRFYQLEQNRETTVYTRSRRRTVTTRIRRAIFLPFSHI